MEIEADKIKLIDDGVYSTILWCAASKILKDILNPHYQYVLCWDYTIGDGAWKEFSLPLLNPKEPVNLISRVVNFDFIMKTDEFINIIPKLPRGISVVQINKLPPYYLDLRKIQGKQLFRILRECEWYLYLDTPGNDYGSLLSPDQELLEKAIRMNNIA